MLNKLLQYIVTLYHHIAIDCIAVFSYRDTYESTEYIPRDMNL